MKQKRHLTVTDVFDGLDGRTRTWLSRQLEREGNPISASCLCNYVKGWRVPDQPTLRLIRSILSSEKSAQRRRDLKRQRHMTQHQPQTLAEVFSEEKEQRHDDKGREGFTTQDGL
jgi:hypothetical protein